MSWTVLFLICSIAKGKEECIIGYMNKWIEVMMMLLLAVVTERNAKIQQSRRNRRWWWRRRERQERNCRREEKRERERRKKEHRHAYKYKKEMRAIFGFCFFEDVNKNRNLFDTLRWIEDYFLALSQVPGDICIILSLSIRVRIWFITMNFLRCRRF